MGPSLDLSKKNILVTGGSRGLGFAVAQTCLQFGARVVICARDESRVREAVKELGRVAGPKAVRGVAADVGKCEQIDAALDVLESHFGALTSLVHAAAVQTPIGNITEVDPDEWLETVRIDLFGAFIATRQACLRMQPRGGRIVLFAGGGAASPRPNFTAYACSKAAVVRLAETAALEMAHQGIEVNVLAPGPVRTRLLEQAIGAGEHPAAEEVPASLGAGAAAFLISDRAAGITGKFVAAPHDGWQHWHDHLAELSASDIFTLRRILPRDRGMDWQ
jgi:NAD(P)-dependent dehydrogenase (short-subunit alcohol dehydrogenase family)